MSDGVQVLSGPSLREAVYEKPVIWRGHALDLIEAVEKKSVDLIVTDPPYAFGGSGDEHAISATVATVLRESAYRLKPGGWAVIFAASSWRSTFYMIEATRGLLDPIRIGTWAKPVSKTRVRTPGWSWASVNVIVLKRRGKGSYGQPCPDLDWIETEGEGNDGFIVAPVVRNGRRAELPPEVARWAVAPFATPGGNMLDPFAGSGALLEAAAVAGMRTVGFEIEGAT